MHRILRLVVCIVLCEGAGLLGAVFTMPRIRDWYQTLKKPSFSPPDWLFGPAWTVLYLLMGIALFLIWNRGLGHGAVRLAVIVFAVQLVLNVLWSIVFFGLKLPLAGLIEIVLLWIAILLTIIYSMAVSRPAGILLVPYILWVSFATALNAAIVFLNRARPG
jgi:tryptophan-rich sensory protein